MARSFDQTGANVLCGHDLYLWPWYCTRPVDHDGPCALYRRWFL